MYTLNVTAEVCPEDSVLDIDHAYCKPSCDRPSKYTEEDVVVVGNTQIPLHSSCPEPRWLIVSDEEQQQVH